MKIRFNLNSVIKKASTLMLLILFASCSHQETDFLVKGDSALLKDVKVNIEMIRDKQTKIATVFYNGSSYAVANDDVLRYKIYMSYQDKYFNTIEMDNLHDKIKGKPLNEITVVKKDNKIMVSYKGIEESSGSESKELLVDEVFFASNDVQEQKQKFIDFYK